MSEYLKNLALKEQTGSIIEPLLFDAKTTAALQKWLDLDQIEALRARAEHAKHVWFEQSEDPTLGDERIVLQRAAELAAALAKILEQAPSSASAELDLIFQKYLGGYQQKELTSVKLGVLACMLEMRLIQMPIQGRRKSPVFLVSQIAEVLNAADIKTSASEGSRFYKICQIIFDSVGIYQSPAAPIRVILNT